MNFSNPLKKIYIEISKLSHQQQKHSDYYDSIIYNYNYTIQIHNKHTHTKKKKPYTILEKYELKLYNVIHSTIIIIIIVYNDYWPSHTHKKKQSP